MKLVSALLMAACAAVGGCDNQAEKAPTDSTAKVAARTDAFDLSCVGTTESDMQKIENHKQVLHVDLASGTWCRDDCKRIFQIASVEPGTIYLSKAVNPEDGVTIALNRVTGEIDDTLRGDGISILGHSTCTKNQFTPFPKTQF